MTYEEILKTLTPDIYQNFKRAVELGKWPGGQKLTQGQKSICLQAIIAYEVKHLPETERTGYIPPKKDSPCEGTGEVVGLDDEKPLKWH